MGARGDYQLMLNFDRNVPRKPRLACRQEGAQYKMRLPCREAPPCACLPVGRGGELHIHLTFACLPVGRGGELHIHLTFACLPVGRDFEIWI
jgi:hypothetical protein